MIESLRQVRLLPCLPLVHHQPPAIALVSRTRLRAIADVLPIRRIQRSLIGGLVVGCDVLRWPSICRDGEQIIVRAGGLIFLGIRREANLLPAGRKGIHVLPAQMKRRRIVISRRQIARARVGTAALGCPVERSSTVITTATVDCSNKQ